MLRNLHEIQFLFSRKTEEGGKRHTVKLQLFSRQHFEDPKNQVSENKNLFFSHYLKIVSDYLLLHAAITSLWITGLWIFNIFFLALYKINIFLTVLIHKILTQCIPLGLICVSMCVHAVPIFVPFFFICFFYPCLYNCNSKTIY